MRVKAYTVTGSHPKLQHWKSNVVPTGSFANLPLAAPGARILLYRGRALALGVAANTAVFSVIHVVLLRLLPFPDSAHLLRLFQAKTPNDSATQSGVSPGNFIDWQEQNALSRTWRQHSPFITPSLAMVRRNTFEVAAVSAAWFAVLGMQPLLGLAEDSEFLLLKHNPEGLAVTDFSPGIMIK